ncbi:hypothetical protein GCM10027572_03210 [Flexivirga lutea]
MPAAAPELVEPDEHAASEAAATITTALVRVFLRVIDRQLLSHEEGPLRSRCRRPLTEVRPAGHEPQ